MARHQRKQCSGLEWLDQVIGRATAHRFDSTLDSAESGHQQHRQLRLSFADGAQQLMTIHARHVHVTDYQAERLLGNGEQRRLGTVDGAVIVATELEGVSQGFAQRAIVFNQQDFGSHGSLLNRGARWGDQRQNQQGAGTATWP